MRFATAGVSVWLRAGQATCSSEMSCTTSTRLCEASATAKMKVAARSGERVELAELAFRVSQQLPQPCMIGLGRTLRRQLGSQGFDGALGVENLAGAHAGQVELDGQRFRKQPRVALSHAGPAAPAHADVGDAQRLQRSQGIARNDAAHAEAGGNALFGAEAVTRLQAPGEQGLAHLRDDLRRKRPRSAGQVSLVADAVGRDSIQCVQNLVHHGLPSLHESLMY